jgi:long-chain acyl-CoA synthetase
MKYDDKPWLKVYNKWVVPEFPIPDVSFVDLMEEIFRDLPDRPAYHYLGITRTYRDLDLDSARFAAFLSGIGCKPGDVVGINLPNIPQSLIAFVGTLRAGCAVTGVSPLLTPQELEYQINDSDTKVLVTLDALFEHKFVKIHDRVPKLSHVVTNSIVDFLPGPKRFLAKLLKKVPTGKVAPVGDKKVVDFMDLLRSYPPEKPRVSIKPEDTALIYYTGGTTGPPKGAELSHRNIVSNSIMVGEWCTLERGKELFCSAFPFFHLAGTAVYTFAIRKGATYVLIPDPRNTDHICRELATYRPTIIVNVPSLYMMLLENPAFKKLDHSGVKTVFSSSAPLAVETIRALESVFGEGKIVEAYGMTETGPLLTLNPIGKARAGSVGVPLPNVRLKLVDIEKGTKEVPFGKEGEIIAQSPSIMKCYRKKAEETKKALRLFNGEVWMYTGDVGKMSDDGYLSVVDRAKDMIIVSGYKVFSKEVEDKLYKHPGVELCAFVGVSDPKRPGSEIVKAFIQLRDAYKKKEQSEVEADILAFCRENMSAFKIPKIIKFVDQIPLTSVGKVDKKALREK